MSQSLTDLPERLDDQQLATVERVAQLPVPALPPVSEESFLKCMRMLTLLPARQEDDLSAELRLALYRRHFGHLPSAAWTYLVDHATMECKFFPTPSECRAILDKWSRTDGPARAVAYARTRARHELQTRLDDAMRRLRAGEMSQAEADALPERWKLIGVAQGHLRPGTFEVRPVRGEKQEGQGPATDQSNTAGRGERDPEPHEGTDQ